MRRRRAVVPTIMGRCASDECSGAAARSLGTFAKPQAARETPTALVRCPWVTSRANAEGCCETPLADTSGTEVGGPRGVRDVDRGVVLYDSLGRHLQMAVDRSRDCIGESVLLLGSARSAWREPVAYAGLVRLREMVRVPNAVRDTLCRDAQQDDQGQDSTFVAVGRDRCADHPPLVA
jgi:hypothetical protein